MWDRLLQLLPVGCRHRHMSVPFSANSNTRSGSGQHEWEDVSQQQFGMYVVCLDCGKHFAYDWSEMRVMK